MQVESLFNGKYYADINIRLQIDEASRKSEQTKEREQLKSNQSDVIKTPRSNSVVRSGLSKRKIETGRNSMMSRKSTKLSSPTKSMSPTKMIALNVLKDHDWEKTPIFRQYVLGQTEE